MQRGYHFGARGTFLVRMGGKDQGARQLAPARALDTWPGPGLRGLESRSRSRSVLHLKREQDGLHTERTSLPEVTVVCRS